MKQMIMATQSRGGCGKSTIIFLLSERYKSATVLDLDDATSATMKQLAYRMPILVSFIDKATKRIDRGAFNSMFESVAAADQDMFLADAGASVAEQLPKYFEMSGPKNVQQLLDQSGIDLKMVCVVGGGNNFKSTMMYLDELVESVNRNFEIIAAYNKHFPMSETQKQIFEDYCNNEGLKSFSFDLVNDKGELALRTAEDVLLRGQGLSGLNPFKAVYFKGCVENIPDLF